MIGCQAPLPQGMPGEGKKSSQGTCLLNIAGEKIEGSGILGKRKKHRK